MNNVKKRGRRYKDTTITPAQSLSKIRKLVEDYEASGFAFAERGQDVMVEFVIAHVRVRFLMAMPSPDEVRYNAAGAKMSAKQATQALAKTTRLRWRGLQELIQAKLEAWDLGVLSFEEAFLPHIVIESGRTIAQALAAGEMIPTVYLPAPKGATDER